MCGDRKLGGGRGDHAGRLPRPLGALGPCEHDAGPDRIPLPDGDERLPQADPTSSPRAPPSTVARARTGGLRRDRRAAGRRGRAQRAHTQATSRARVDRCHGLLERGGRTGTRRNRRDSARTGLARTGEPPTSGRRADMNDTRELLERVGGRFAFPDEAFERLERRRDRKRRNRRIAAVTLALALFVGLAVAGVTVIRSAPAPLGGGRPPSGVEHPPTGVGNGRIFASIGDAIVSFDPNHPRGSREIAVQDGALADRGLAWSPDGSRLAFAVSLHDRRNDAHGIWILDVSSGLLEQIAPCPTLPCPRLLDWSPHGSQVAVAQAGDLYLMGLDGERGPTLASFAGDEIGQPSWSPDGSKIAFSVRGEGFSRLYVVGADGSGLTLLLDRAFNGALDP